MTTEELLQEIRRRVDNPIAYYYCTPEMWANDARTLISEINRLHRVETNAAHDVVEHRNALAELAAAQAEIDRLKAENRRLNCDTGSPCPGCPDCVGIR